MSASAEALPAPRHLAPSWDLCDLLARALDRGRSEGLVDLRHLRPYRGDFRLLLERAEAMYLRQRHPGAQEYLLRMIDQGRCALPAAHLDAEAFLRDLTVATSVQTSPGRYRRRTDEERRVARMALNWDPPAGGAARSEGLGWTFLQLLHSPLMKVWTWDLAQVPPADPRQVDAFAMNEGLLRPLHRIHAKAITCPSTLTSLVPMAHRVRGVTLADADAIQEVPAAMRPWIRRVDIAAFAPDPQGRRRDLLLAAVICPNLEEIQWSCMSAVRGQAAAGGHHRMSGPAVAADGFRDGGVLTSYDRACSEWGESLLDAHQRGGGAMDRARRLNRPLLFDYAGTIAPANLDGGDRTSHDQLLARVRTVLCHALKDDDVAIQCAALVPALTLRRPNRASNLALLEVMEAVSWVLDLRPLTPWAMPAIAPDPRRMAAQARRLVAACRFAGGRDVSDRGRVVLDHRRPGLVSAPIPCELIAAETELLRCVLVESSGLPLSPGAEARRADAQRIVEGLDRAIDQASLSPADMTRVQEALSGLVRSSFVCESRVTPSPYSVAGEMLQLGLEVRELTREEQHAAREIATWAAARRGVEGLRRQRWCELLMAQRHLFDEHRVLSNALIGDPGRDDLDAPPVEATRLLLSGRRAGQVQHIDHQGELVANPGRLSWELAIRDITGLRLHLPTLRVPARGGVVPPPMRLYCFQDVTLSVGDPSRHDLAPFLAQLGEELPQLRRVRWQSVGPTALNMATPAVWTNGGSLPRGWRVIQDADHGPMIGRELPAADRDAASDPAADPRAVPQVIDLDQMD